MSYSRLLRALKQELARARLELGTRLVRMYWIFGREIAAFLDAQGGPSHGDLAALARRLAPDLQSNPRTLEQCYQFFCLYPRIDFNRPIEWSLYRCLFSIPSVRQRRYWEGRIIKEKLSQKELLILLKQERERASGETRLTGDGINTDGRLPEPARGLLYHYRLVKVGYVDRSPDGILVDCGFCNHVEPPTSAARLENKRIMRSDRQDGRYSLKVAHVTQDALFTFQARVERVVDADTLLVNVDCGFGIWTRRRLRLKGINAAELSTTDGLRAKAWVEERLKPCAFVVIKTYQKDKYGRRLTDVFYHPKETDARRVAESGIYLNQELITAGQAVVYGK